MQRNNGILPTMPAQSKSEEISAGLSRQKRLVEALCAPRFFQYRPSIQETHISWVLLTGHDAYKIKKSVDLGFLDFSTLEKRRFFCGEELRLNRRLAPQLYLDVLTIGGDPDQPVLGGEPAIEYAVHMRRFAQNELMDNMLSRRLVRPDHIDRLAEIIAGFHNALPPAAADSSHCAIASIQEALMQNFAHLPHLLVEPDDLATLDTVRNASALEFAVCERLFRQRAETGCVRECHGDLHLGNIVLLDDTPTPFDGIEFSESLRWIDVISEISFTVMDLLRRGRPRLAWRLFNRYLETTGDFSGVGVLRFYLAYRAMVRAKIAAIRAGQRDFANVKKELKSCRSYLHLAHSCLTLRGSAVIITQGLPGCGKSTFAQIALEVLGAIRIRSDVERKRLFGLEPLADSKAQIDVDIYSKEATLRTYARLQELARDIVAAGFPVIVDAAFVLQSEREIFRALAQEMAVPFVIASVQTDTAVMEERLKQRSRQGSDASEAGISVMQKLQGFHEPLRDSELSSAVIFNNNGDVVTLEAAAEWKSLEEHLV
jgi:uncharacterized protein